MSLPELLIPASMELVYFNHHFYFSYRNGNELILSIKKKADDKRKILDLEI